jgi:hypothetical protein
VIIIGDDMLVAYRFEDINFIGTLFPILRIHLEDLNRRAVKRP